MSQGDSRLRANRDRSDRRLRVPAHLSPAVDKLSHESSRGAIGLVTLILTSYLGGKTFREAYKYDDPYCEQLPRPLQRMRLGVEDDLVEIER